VQGEAAPPARFNEHLIPGIRATSNGMRPWDRCQIAPNVAFFVVLPNFGQQLLM